MFKHIAQTISQTLACVASSGIYWLALTAFSLLNLVVALYYQYALNEWPCVLCIHIRLWFSLLLLLGIIGFFLRHRPWPRLLSHLASLLVALGLVERSYMLLGTEKGFVFSDCGFDAGLPAWLALEDWLPWLYRVETSCGYTPELLLGITMAEALMTLSVLLLVLALSMSTASAISLRKQNLPCQGD